MSHSRIYSIWKGIRRRCNNPNAPKYEYYGGLGIKVCEEWDHPYGGFESFYKWAIENGYKDNLSIDRIDSSKNYCPENCQWISIEENRVKAISKRRRPRYQYFAYNKKENKIVIFYKIIDFANYSGMDVRRVSEESRGINTKNNWIIKRIPIKDANIIEGQETIPLGSTLEDELPTEVQIIRLGIDNLDYCLKFLHTNG